MTELDPEVIKRIEEICKNSRLTDDDCLTDEEFEEWAGCKRASREEIAKRNRENRKKKK